MTTATTSASSTSGRAAAFVLGGAISSLFSIGLSMVRSKATALWVGPEGFGIVALVAQAVALGLVASTMAAHTSLVRAMAQACREGPEAEDEAIAGAFWITLLIHALGAIAVAAVALVMLPPSLPISIPLALTLSVFATLGTNLSTVASQYFVAIANVRVMTLNGIIATIIGTAVTLPLVWIWRVPGMFWALALGNLTAASVTWLFLRKQRGKWPAMLPIRARAGFVREVMTLGGVAVLGGLCLQGQLAAVRYLLEHYGGEEGIRNNGFFQAAWAVAGTYMTVVLSGLMSYFTPRMAGAKSTSELQDVVDECARYVLQYVAPLALIGICFGAPAIHILYSQSFGPAAAVLDLLLCSAPLRALSWAYANTLPMRNHARAYLVSELVSLALGIPMQWWAISKFGINGAGFGIVAQHALYLPIAVVLQRHASGVAARARHIGAAYGVAVIGLFLHFTVDLSIWVRWVAAGLCLVLLWRLGVLSELMRRLSRKPKEAPL